MPTETDKLKEQVERLQKQMDELRGTIPTDISITELEERVASIEETNPAAFEMDAFTPDMSRSGDLMDVRKMPTSIEEEFKILPFDIEFGRPNNSITADSDTITMRPCDEGGTFFASATSITVYVANDRRVQELAQRGWTSSTILPFIRFSPFVSGTPNIEGYLIGERPAIIQPGDIIIRGAAGSRPGFLNCDGSSYLRTDQQALFNAIGTNFGAVDGTHFNVPNMAEMVPRGSGVNPPFDVVGNTGGVKTIDLEHTHDRNSIDIDFGAGVTLATSANPGPSWTGTSNPPIIDKPDVVTDQHDNRGPFLVMFYMIKT